MKRALLLSGGPGHDSAATSTILADLLAVEGVRAAVVTDPTEVFDRLAADEPDLLVVNARRWHELRDHHSHQQDEWAATTPPTAAPSVAGHLSRGGGILCVHTGFMCFDDWPGWGELLGGAWDWDRSSHAAAGPIDVVVHADRHPIVHGLNDFETHDEVYGFLHHPTPVEALASSGHGGSMHPVLWAHERERGRVVVDTLGHDPRSYEARQHRDIIRRSIRWTSRVALA
ncbi:MAG TPA: ThuA domain-containing protein [Acidimicrobiales bacterium]